MSSSDKIWHLFVCFLSFISLIFISFSFFKSPFFFFVVLDQIIFLIILWCWIAHVKDPNEEAVELEHSRSWWHVAMGPWHILQLTSCHHILGFVMYWKCCSTVLLYMFRETPWCTCLWKPCCTCSGKHPGVLAYRNPVVHVQGNTLVYLLMETVVLVQGNTLVYLLMETLLYLFRESSFALA